MAKRFVEVGRWGGPFMRSLKPEYKVLWCYILDHCDNSGIWTYDPEQAELHIGMSINWSGVLPAFAGKVYPIDGGRRWFIRPFIDFQYPSGLQEKNPAHKNIFTTIQKFGLKDILEAPYIAPSEAPIQGAKEYVYDMEEGKEQVQAVATASGSPSPPTSDIIYPDDNLCAAWAASEMEVGGKVVRLPNPASMTFPGDDGSLGWAVALRRVWDKVTPQSGNGLKILHGIQCFSDIDPPSFWDNAIWYLTYKIVTDSIPHNLENWIKDEHFRKDWKEVFHTDSKVKKKAAPIFEQLRFEQEMNEAISKFKR